MRCSFVFCFPYKSSLWNLRRLSTVLVDLFEWCFKLSFMFFTNALGSFLPSYSSSLFFFPQVILLLWMVTKDLSIYWSSRCPMFLQIPPSGFFQIRWEMGELSKCYVCPQVLKAIQTRLSRKVIFTMKQSNLEQKVYLSWRFWMMVKMWFCFFGFDVEKILIIGNSLLMVLNFTCRRTWGNSCISI